MAESERGSPVGCVLVPCGAAAEFQIQQVRGAWQFALVVIVGDGDRVSPLRGLRVPALHSAISSAEGR